jgi:hypothetical protein
LPGRGNQKIEQRDGRYHRLLTGFKKLLDVSTTWNPAYPNTEAQFRSKALEYADSPESWQRILMGAYPQLEDTGRRPRRYVRRGRRGAPHGFGDAPGGRRDAGTEAFRGSEAATVVHRTHREVTTMRRDDILRLKEQRHVLITDMQKLFTEAETTVG